MSRRWSISRPAPTPAFDRRAVLLNIAAASAGAATLGFGACVADVRKLVAPSGDRTGEADHVALQRVLDEGGIASLQPGGRYILARGLRWRRDSSGFVCPGTANFVMRTGPGQFDIDAYDGGLAFGPHHVAFFARSIDQPVLNGIRITLDQQPGIKCAIPFEFAACSNLQIGRLEMSGFREAYRGLLAMGSCKGGVVGPLWIHDCIVSSDALPGLQLTGVEIDNDRWPPSARTEGVHFRPIHYRNLLVRGPAMRKYGPQSDAVNVQTIGWSGCSFEMIAGEGVGEALDCWGDGVSAKLEATDTQLYPLKLINGASGCTIEAVIRRTGLSALYRGPQTYPTGRNRVRLDATGVGALNAELKRTWPSMPSPQPGVYYDMPANPAGYIKPVGDRISGRLSIAQGVRTAPFGGGSWDPRANSIELGT